MNFESLSDNHLINLAIDNHKEAFGILWERHHENIDEYVGLVAPNIHSDAIIIDIFTQTYQQLASYSAQISFEIWLIRLSLEHIIHLSHRSLRSDIQRATFYYCREFKEYSHSDTARIYRTTVMSLYLRYTAVPTCIEYLRAFFSSIARHYRNKKIHSDPSVVSQPNSATIEKAFSKIYDPI
jgi:hypothetical protein